MNDEELDIFWRLKRLEEKKSLIREHFSDNQKIERRPMPKKTANDDNTSCYNIPEIRSNTFYQAYREKHDRILRRRTQPEPINNVCGDTKRITASETQKTTGAETKIRKNFTLKPEVNWFKVYVVISIII